MEKREVYFVTRNSYVKRLRICFPDLKLTVVEYVMRHRELIASKVSLFIVI